MQRTRPPLRDAITCCTIDGQPTTVSTSLSDVVITTVIRPLLEKQSHGIEGSVSSVPNLFAVCEGALPDQTGVSVPYIGIVPPVPKCHQSFIVAPSLASAD